MVGITLQNCQYNLFFIRQAYLYVYNEKTLGVVKFLRLKFTSPNSFLLMIWVIQVWSNLLKVHVKKFVLKKLKNQAA